MLIIILSLKNSNSEFRFNSQYDVTFTELINVEK